MIKFYVLFFALFAVLQANAKHGERAKSYQQSASSGFRNKPTSIGDTAILRNMNNDTVVAYHYGSMDSGYTYGTNIYNDAGYAERYDFNATDSSIRVLGIVTQFTGVVSATSTKQVNLKLWTAGRDEIVGPGRVYNGFPDICIDTIITPFNLLGTNKLGDTTKVFLFKKSTTPLNGSFFVGYDMLYDFSSLSGDTIGLYSSINGNRSSVPFYYRTGYTLGGDTIVDTVIQVQNATLYNDNTWHENYTDNTGLYNNLAIFPLVVVSNPTSVPAVMHRGLSFFGCFPNPAANTTTVRISTAASSNAYATVYSITGAVVLQAQQFLDAGTHDWPIALAGLPAGTYTLLLRTDPGAAVATILVVAP